MAELIVCAMKSDRQAPCPRQKRDFNLRKSVYKFAFALKYYCPATYHQVFRPICRVQSYVSFAPHRRALRNLRSKPLPRYHRAMPVPILTVEQMRQWEDASWDAGRSEADVIENVGQALANVALRMTREDDRILILAGKGHNGDDARAAQPHLIDRRVKLLNVNDPVATLQ